MWDYWASSLDRSFWASLSWIYEQGLTPGRVLLALGVLAITAFNAWRRYQRRVASREDTGKAINAAIKTFGIFLASGVLMACTLVFGYFLLADPPSQIAAKNRQITQALAEKKTAMTANQELARQRDNALEQLRQLKYQQYVMLGRTSWFNLYSTLKNPPDNLNGTTKHIIISSSSGNGLIAKDLNTLFVLSWSVSKAFGALGLPNYERDLGAPKFVVTDRAGITIHGASDVVDYFANTLGHCYLIHKSSEMPGGIAEYYNHLYPTTIPLTDTFIWIEIGDGFPLATGDCHGAGN